ncbi:hypothetical protein D3C83_130070 [compost metagenome]
MPDLEPVVSGIKEIARDGVAAVVSIFSLGETESSASPIQTSAVPDNGADPQQSE